ncbi:PELOTA RNA binding domain-containing protein [Sanguibacter gelidistatuariae]|uniref:PELOTA RNA binding domain-containing protein n=1 Tax=Sanguibacter gelidistatuariae TaxID=1814289 RepID=A0A1G6HHJ2_9MICO|nr:cysteine protease StiP family protein [Sanguibacter gelidistatuariae]SDB93729.1 PELOTA RNA binding domain-containing protein [Sanguibacter gelidistatuariae]
MTIHPVTAQPVTARPTPDAGPASELPEPLYGPDFGSYDAHEVAWLLSDLSSVELEAPTEEREEAIQSGGAHYAESLPVEYQPTQEYQDLFHSALRASATRLAHAVGVVTDLVLAERGERAVLVSLARAGTPIGVLMRRWASYAHGLNLPHYAASIVRGRGIDQVALAYLAAHHRPEDIMFVDGWTGKGAISRELAAAVEQANVALGLSGTGLTGAGLAGADLGDDERAGFSADLAVLADPGHCAELFGTREDYLIPSACLNSTVSGLVSRTVLNDALIGPGMFHGAKFYADLAPADVSAEFCDVVSMQFSEVAASVAETIAARQAAPAPEITWAGWKAVEAISAEYGLGDVNLVKPGVGETTRVLLRRVPWKILVRADASAELAHVRLLAAQRGVEVVEVEDLPYSCVGLIHPQFTRGATGADGTASR